jgi:capping protein alpha
MEEATSGPVTDVVAEQVGAGENEPLPTPLAEDVDPKKEEVDEPGGIEKLDEAVEEVKHEEEDEEAREGKGEVEPKVEDETTASPQTGSEEGEEEKKLETVTEPETASKPRRQERVENPVYTVEIVGNRYNPSNFW